LLDDLSGTAQVKLIAVLREVADEMEANLQRGFAQMRSHMDS
jgi:hypothetical protein